MLRCLVHMVWGGNFLIGRVLADLLSTLKKYLSHFKAARAGKLGTHSLRKGSSTYASWFGLLRDWISLRGCWQASKKQVNVYIDVDVPYHDATVASILCGSRGPCKYAERDEVDLSDDFLCSIAP